mmetsp:Transcript_29408/g.66682  ORF Transcript_29408/g.66682 Transcript_29408/m.66682 type:complete len:225 (+) Transcript_29408:149-823(+)
MTSSASSMALLLPTNCSTSRPFSLSEESTSNSSSMAYGWASPMEQVGVRQVAVKTCGLTCASTPSGSIATRRASTSACTMRVTRALSVPASHSMSDTSHMLPGSRGRVTHLLGMPSSHTRGGPVPATCRTSLTYLYSSCRCPMSSPLRGVPLPGGVVQASGLAGGGEGGPQSLALPADVEIDPPANGPVDLKLGHGELSTLSCDKAASSPSNCIHTGAVEDHRG